MSVPLRWGILGTGKIARIFGGALAGARTGRLHAVASRSEERAERYGAELGAVRRYGSYDQLLEADEVDVVYVATPHTEHVEWGIRAADAGKHVLCEKPLGVNRHQAAMFVEAAARNDVFLMEGFAYRTHPQTARLLDLIRDGAVGEVRVIEAVFGYDAGPDPANYLLDHDLAGGAILDVGCYTTSMARVVAGTALGSAFAEPVEIRGIGHVGVETRVDHYAVASASFAGGIVATLACGIRADLGSSLRIVGSEGTIQVPSPWLPGLGGAPTAMILDRSGSARRQVAVDPGQDLYAIEADAVGDQIQARQAAPPGMTWEDSLGNMATLDQWRASIGLVYDLEAAAESRPGSGSSGSTATGRQRGM